MKKCLPLFAAVLLAGCFVSAPDGKDVSVSAVAAEARSRLAADSLTDRAALSVTVSDGVATLSGPVASEAVRQRALQILQGTPGVFAVEDRTFRQ
jgi:osmotically-inducible protein OsmY